MARQPVEYFQETVDGEREPLALFPFEREHIDGVWYTLAYGRLWHLANERAYGERRLTDAQCERLHKIKIAFAADAAPDVVAAGTAYLADYLRRR